VTGTPGPRTSARAWLVRALGMVAHTAAVPGRRRPAQP